MNIKLHIASLIFLLISAHLVFPQGTRKEQADKDYKEFMYIKAGELYEKLLENGYESQDIYGKLADTYYFNAQYKKALPHYTKMLAYHQSVDPAYYFRYAQCLKVEGKYREADKALQEFYTRIGHPDGPKLVDQLAIIEQNSGRYTIEEAGINTPYSDFGTAFMGDDKVVFASARDAGVFVKHINKWNEKPFLKLYVASMDSEGGLKKVKILKGDINGKYHQSTPAITKDGNTMYFTRNNYHGRTHKEVKGDVNQLRIFKAVMVNGKWGKIEDLSINSEGYSTGHPALSPDEKQLYFVSDRPGSSGKSDIYVADIRENGTMGPAKSLGDVINTPGRETFPFVEASGTLYFASDGHPGLGGLDIFAAVKRPSGEYHVLNIGKPINSTYDDFCFIQRDSTGFFSSNRESDKKGQAGDNIYRFKEIEPLPLPDDDDYQKVGGTVRDEETQEPIEGAKVTVYDPEEKVLKELVTDKNGKFSGEFLRHTYYVLKVKYPNGYQGNEVFAIPNKDDRSDVKVMKIDMEPNLKEIRPGDDLAKKFEVKQIYFDLDKWDIRPDAEAELAKILIIMKKIPELRIDIRSYTDSRGSHVYNQGLSDKRARSTINWLVKKGIDKSRLIGRGYGETELLNHCASGVKCTEDEHQINRRSEFIVLGMGKK